MNGFLPIYVLGYRYELNISGEGRYTLSKEPGASLYLPCLSKTYTITSQADGLFCSVNDESVIILERPQRIDEIWVERLQTVPVRILDTTGKNQLLFSQDDKGHVQFADAPCQFLLERQANVWQLKIFSGPIFVNNCLFEGTTLTLENGDELTFGNKKVKVFEQEVYLWGETAISQTLAERIVSRYAFPEGYPDYHRSPRIIYRGSEEKIDLIAPPAEVREPNDQLLKLIVPPLVMIAMTLIITLVQPRGIYILLTVAMSVVTLIFSISNYIKNRKKYKEDVQARVESYRHYLGNKAKELHQKAAEYREGRLYHYPTITHIAELTASYNHRIYEKTALHHDFLHYRLGIGRLKPTYFLNYTNTERSKATDDLEKEGYALYSENRKVNQVPVVANLIHGPVGYIGERQLVIEQLQLMINQLATFHSYHDVQFITIFPEEEKHQWDWMRWLPHATLQGMNVRGFVYDQRTRDQVLNSLNQILKGRQNRDIDKTRSTLHLPHYVVLITDEQLVLDHVIMEFFNEDPTQLGCSVVFVADVLSSLSENVKTIINIKDRNQAELVIEEGALKELEIALDHFPSDFDKEVIARRLAPLNHLQTLKASIPTTVTFLEMYGVEKFQDLDVAGRWLTHSPHQSLAVPIGLRGQDDLVELDLHERAHGPHGLIAGTTGSGKSELIQSYILSLAVNFHPYDVAFLLIDYKGGGMANLFKDLPHVLGTITNLDGHQSMRALESIKAELHRRQRLFAKYGVNHIHQYQKKFKEGEVLEPLPHLFLISDEFAELKAEQPDFISELVSTSRIGRSLGVNLILATQKPTGVVNDQIWSNSNFRIALKVADRADSQEMLRTPDAADINQAGRAYLQVGNNDIYELFQSAWSGADYQPDKEALEILDQNIYTINALGQYVNASKDLSGLDEAIEVREISSELVAVVQGIAELAETQGIQSLPQPWLPPLADEVILEDLAPVNYKTTWEDETQAALVLHIGMADLPHLQAQQAVSINLTEDGHVLLYGSPGYGKTTFLQTSVMDLVRHHSPAHLNIYLLDFGTNGLAALSQLPHVADRLLLDQTEKISKFIRLLQDEIAHRKNLLTRHGVGTISQYTALTGLVIPTIVIALDSFEAIRDESFEEALFKLLIQISREGLSVGLHLLMTASRQSNIRTTLYTNFKHQLTLRQNDSTEVVNIVGHSNLSQIEDVKGRALMKLDRVTSLQLALPIRAEHTIQMIELLRQEALDMRQHWQGQLPKAIPMLPVELTEASFFADYPSVQASLEMGRLPLGLDKETVTSSFWNFQLGNLLYLYDKDGEVLEMTNYLIRQIEKMKQKVVVVSPEYSFLEVADGIKVYRTKEDYAELLGALSLRLNERLEAKQRDNAVIVIWHNYDEIVSKLMPVQQEQLMVLFEKGPRVGYLHVVMSRPSSLSKLQDGASRTAKAFKQNLMTMRVADQVIVSPINRPIRELPMLNQENYFVVNGLAGKLMVPIKSI